MGKEKGIGIGVLVFNPLDDENHLERVEKSIKSIIRSCENSKYSSRVVIVLNESIIEHLGIRGVGEKTKKLVNNIIKDTFLDLKILSKSYNNSMARGYNYLLKYFHKETDVDKICVYADDYIIPKKWVDIILDEFNKFSDADFIMPSTTFVAQKNLFVPFKIPTHWEKNEIANGNVLGISNGVKIYDIDYISERLNSQRTIRYFAPPSFETTVFTRNFVDRYGYLCGDYYSLFFNREYFERSISRGAKGYISRKSFVFHYGKGGTKALYKETGDEKFAGSPVEINLINDVDLYNKRNNTNIAYWWRNQPNGQAPVIKIPCNFKIRLFVLKYNLLDFIRRYPSLYNTIHKMYKR